ncbi:MAG: hypothetical protein NVSMB62_09690 [Acidobacteriaceae bacterium]
MASERILLVDDDETLRSGLGMVLEASGFNVSTAPGAPDALRLIASHTYDVLLTDLHMPGAGDGLTVISAMRHVNPQAMTLLLSANPNLAKATAAILSQVDEVILKPVKATFIVERIRDRLNHHPAPANLALSPGEDVAALLESESEVITSSWLEELSRPAARGAPQIDLSADERTEHLPEALRDIVFRLRYPQPPGSASVFSMSALQHGARRRRQGIGAPTLVEEARALQIAIFRTLIEHSEHLNPAQMPTSIMAIADEISAQIQQAIEGYENEQPSESPWGFR